MRLFREGPAACGPSRSERNIETDFVNCSAKQSASLVRRIFASRETLSPWLVLREEGKSFPSSKPHFAPPLAGVIGATLRRSRPFRAGSLLAFLAYFRCSTCASRWPRVPDSGLATNPFLWINRRSGVASTCERNRAAARCCDGSKATRTEPEHQRTKPKIYRTSSEEPIYLLTTPSNGEF